MERRKIGVGLIAVSALLHIGRYLAAAIYMSGGDSESAELFRASLRYVGSIHSYLAGAALIAGIVYLAAGEIECILDKKRRSKWDQGMN